MVSTGNNKIIVILGPTSSGKTALSIKLAKKGVPFGSGEVVSADSRQVYKGMDIGSGKITKKEMQGVPHHLLDVANPKRRFSVAQYQKLALKAIRNIQKKNKIPFIVGGTGFYIQSIVDGVVPPEVKPDWKLRKELEKKSNEELFDILKNKDPRRAETIDKNNPRRLIRALEIVLTTKKPIPALKPKHMFDVLQIGIMKSKDELSKNIKSRLLKRLKQGMIKEVENLKKSGLSYKRLEEFGLEYRYVAQYLQNKIDYKTMVEKIQKESEHYVARQITWFKRDPRIKWIKNDQNSLKKAEEYCKAFILTNAR